MILDMFDAIFMARRGVLRAQRTPYDAQFAVVLLLLRSDRPTQTQSGQHNGERVAPAAPKNGLLMHARHPSHNSQDKSRLDKCETNDRRGRGSATAARSVSPEGLSPLVLAP